MREGEYCISGPMKQTLGQRFACGKFIEARSWNQYPSGRERIWQKEKLGYETSIKKASDNSKERFGSRVVLSICPK